MALDFIAGCMGGAAGIIVGHPLDTVKVHLQTQNAHNLKYNGTLHCLRSLIATEGLRGIYKGISSPLLGVAGINAIIFGVYGNTQRNLSDSLTSHFIAGATAGFFQTIFCSPMELVKLRLQVSNHHQTMRDCLKKIYENEGGLRGVYRGFNMTVAREIPAFGSYFLTYEYLTRTEDNGPVSTLSMLLAGGLAGIVSWTIVYPIDVLKSRIQIDGINGTNQYRNSLDCLKKSLKIDGYRFLFRGITPTIIRAFPVNAVTFTVVTWTVRLFDRNTDAILLKQNGSGSGSGSGSDNETLWGRCTDAVYTLKVSEPAAV